MELDAGQKVVIPNVGDAAVTGKPERVGEGLVYPVSLNGRDMLLKWYQKPTGDDLYRKIGSINGKAPSASFIWPQYRTEKNDDGSWGYFIGLPPEGFSDLGSVLLGRAKFSSHSAMLSAALRLCGCFRQLHEKGFCFSNLTDSSVLINPESGDVRIIGGDNLAERNQPAAAAQGAPDQAPVSSGEGNPGITVVTPETGAVHVSGGENPPQGGHPAGDIQEAAAAAPESAGESAPESRPAAPGPLSRYLAPEVICGGAPDACSDSFSLSVILFILFFGNHPFEGAAAAQHPYLTDEIRRKLYGSGAVFIFDPENENNRPVRGIHQSVIRSWPSFPNVLKDAFVREFCQEGVRNPSSRLPAGVWEDKIREARELLVRCQNCGKEMFTGATAGPAVCPGCQKPLYTSVLVINGIRTVPLTLGRKIAVAGGMPEAEVTKDQECNLLIKNLSSELCWSVVTPSGKTKTVPPQGIMPVKEGLRIKFRENCTAEIRNY